MAQKIYWIWLDEKAGVLRHDLPQAIKDDELYSGRSFPTWKSAETWLRECMKKGYSVRVYESEG